ncbi:alpha-1,3-mannosyltransferase CMT1 [Verticillium alfalfae VaMs.102]|uniref:Alpha-1,3-mannosyltransferase CMT1 n=1 Tax=Verticillium alfalfae (strain VaMs.102 / ATCC MYA-4576 / FGSC 10136) TaxID=526221 RepID=C9SPM9_VERA1|nr:alpha-1,3-mannosyltransferase CMT1 [Verticillium alfalfae VaMs.102]EEY20744.1 alpha-1,3-mannosyltransferase CMT1 [Verticillium alfalfae VaMs.102]
MHHDRRFLLLIVPVVIFLLLAASLYLGSDHLTLISGLHVPFLSHWQPENQPESITSSSLPDSDATFTSLPVPSSTVLPPARVDNGTVLTAEKIRPYIDSILDPESTALPRLGCPRVNSTRYDIVRNMSEANDNHVDYYFALDLRNCRDLLPRLLGSIVEVMRFLGPDRCALSIVEGHSPDGTADILAALAPFLRRDGFSYHYQSSDINPGTGSRILKLAKLRNLALEPLLNHTYRTSANTTVLFINDVAACAEDLLELALQRRKLDADMTCALDWTYVGRDPTFYDVWVARGINGDSFFNIPPNGSWDYAWNLFWNHPQTKARLDSNVPFQAFACWNGATAFTAAPLLDGLRFRNVHKGECAQGEPQMFCKDLWHRGFGKIAVVPAVNLEYSDEKAEKLKKLKGFTSDLVRHQTEEDAKIEWAGPPEKVKCMEGWQNQFWRPWNETLK